MRWILVISLVILTLLFFQQEKHVLQRGAKPLSMMACHRDQKNLLKKNVSDPRSSSNISSKTAAPLDVPSSNELYEFPGARVVEAVEIAGPHLGEKTRMRILETHFKDPYIRTEETIDAASGALLHRSEMVATHLLVRLPAEEDPEHFLNQLGPDAIALERVTTKDSLYRLQLGSHSLATLPRVFAEINDKKLPLLHEEPDFLVHASMLPNNPLYSQQWYLWQYCSNVEGAYDDRLIYSGIDARDAWDLRTSAESVVVAVIDSGIRYTHEDLAANMWHEEDPIYGTIHGWNFSVPQDDPKKNDPMDGFGHGTACAGIIGGVGNSGVGVVGVAWKVKLMALKFLDDQGMGTGVVSDAVQAIDFACEHGAKILNCSWGFITPEEDQIFGGQFSNLEISPSSRTALQAAISRARDQGVIVVTAAGNEGKNNNEYPEYPANYSLDNIVSVAATMEDNQLAWFSNYGATTVHLAAPGEEIFSTWARSDSDYITIQTREEILSAIYGNGHDFSQQPWGTSFSVPQVVGALALLKAQFPTWTHQQLIKRVIDTSDRIPALEGKTIGGKLNLKRALGDPIN